MSVSHSLTRRLLGPALLSSLLAAATPAHAGVIGSFDPAFGPSIPNLGFRGTINLDVTPGCYALGPGFHFTGGSCQITAQSAQINFFNATTSSGVLSTVSLGAASFGAGYVFGAFFDATGQLAGLDTNDSATFPVAVTDPNPIAPINFVGTMLLYFVSGTATPIGVAAFDPAAATPGVGAAYLVRCPGAVAGCTRNTGTQSNPALLTFTAVPEPDSIALALLGGVALAATRRRSRRTSVERSGRV